MSYRILMWVFAAAVLVAIVTVIDLAKERDGGPVFIANNGLITEDQLRQKMVDRRMDQRVDQPRGAVLPGDGIQGSADRSTRRRLADRSSAG